MDAQAAVVNERVEEKTALNELKQSIFLLALMASSMTTYIAIGVAAVRIFSSR